MGEVCHHHLNNGYAVALNSETPARLAPICPYGWTSVRIFYHATE